MSEEETKKPRKPRSPSIWHIAEVADKIPGDKVLTIHVHPKQYDGPGPAREAAEACAQGEEGTKWIPVRLGKTCSVEKVTTDTMVQCEPFGD